MTEAGAESLEREDPNASGARSATDRADLMAERYAEADRPIQFAGIVVCALPTPGRGASLAPCAYGIRLLRGEHEAGACGNRQRNRDGRTADQILVRARREVHRRLMRCRRD